MVGSGYSSEMFLNLNPNPIIQLFLLPTHDQLQTEVGATHGPSVLAGSGGQVNWSGSLDIPILFNVKYILGSNVIFASICELISNNFWICNYCS